MISTFLTLLKVNLKINEIIYNITSANIAQLVELLICNQEVKSSSLFVSSNAQVYIKDLSNKN